MLISSGSTRAFEDSLDAMQAVGILGSVRPAAAAEIPLTESQIEIWLSAQLGDDASCAFNESVTLRMQGGINADALQTALNRIVARHDALRATFSPTGEAMRISAPGAFEYPTLDLSGRPLAEAEAGLEELLDKDARTAFDLAAGPCIRGTLVKLADDSHAFVLTAHHIVCDGWSINVVVDELAQIYGALCRGEACVLPEALQFSEYARSQAARDAADLARTKTYWMDAFAVRPAPLELPTDRRVRPSNPSTVRVSAAASMPDCTKRSKKPVRAGAAPCS